MKRILLTIICILTAATCMTASAQGINFVEGKTFAEVLAMAKEQGRLVFMDCYTEWCGPCKRMAREEFTKQEAGDYFNAKFVNLKMDMEKGEGPEVAKKYDVGAYPTFLILQADGTLQGRCVGSADIGQFIKKIEDILAEEKGLAWYQQRFNEGERDAKFLDEYAKLLKQNYMRGELKRVVETVLDGKTGAEVAADSTLFKTFLTGGFTPDDPLFLAVYRERATVIDKQGIQAAQTLELSWYQQAMYSIKFDGKTYQGFDREKFDAYKQKMTEYGVTDADRIVDHTLLTNATYANDYPAICQFMEKDISQGGTLFEDFESIRLAEDMAEECKNDKKTMKTLKRFITHRIGVLQKKAPDDKQFVTDRDGTRYTRSEYQIKQYREILSR